MTANDLIASALRLINVLESGEVPTGEEQQDALVVLNDMMESWSADEIKVFATVASAAQNFVAGQQVYTVGPGGNVNIARPASIEKVVCRVLSNPSQPLDLDLQSLTWDGWSSIPVKAVQSAQPTKVWDDNNFPLRNLSFWPIFSGASYQVQFILYMWQQLTAFPDLVTDITFPPAYAKAIRYSLAIDLAPEFGVTQVPDAVVRQAMESMKIMAKQNDQPIDLRCDPGVVGTGKSVYNWMSDTFGRGY